MAHMYSNASSPRIYFGDSYKLTNWTLGSGRTFHMIPAISGSMPGSFVETDKYIEVADRYFFTEK